MGSAIVDGSGCGRTVSTWVQIDRLNQDGQIDRRRANLNTTSPRTSLQQMLSDLFTADGICQSQRPNLPFSGVEAPPFVHGPFEHVQPLEALRPVIDIR